MNELEALQQAFVAAVLGAENPELLAQLQQILPLTPAEALEVYRRDYAARMTEALSDKFPAIGFILGAAAQGLWQDYLAGHRSQHYDLARFGADLPAFLTGHPLLQTYPFLAELAQLELAFEELIHAPVEAPGDLSLLEGLSDPSELVLRLVAPLRVFASAWPLRELWNLRHHTSDPELPPPSPQTLLLFKNAQGIRTSLLSPTQAELLQALGQGLSLSSALDRLTDPNANENPARDVAELFALLRREDLLAAIRLSAGFDLEISQG